MEIAEWMIEGWKLTMDMCVEKSCCFVLSKHISCAISALLLD
jgi:hypothetical protein